MTAAKMIAGQKLMVKLSLASERISYNLEVEKYVSFLTVGKKNIFLLGTHGEKKIKRFIILFCFLLIMKKHKG